MKKIICIVLAVIMTISSIAVFADDSASAAMETALAAVKSKITVPEGLSVFSPHTNMADGKTTYDFTWRDEDYNSSMEVSCDGEGRIFSYCFYDSSLSSDAKLTTLSKEEIVAFADDFLRKTVPSAFSDSRDCLVYDEDSWNVSGSMNYNISYSRYRNGVKVKDNNARVQVSVYNNVPYVRNMSVSFNYDADFEENTSEITDFTEKYIQNFPIEIIYRDKYSYYYKNTDDKDEVVLVYRIKDDDAGYISAVNGEIVTEDEDLILYAGGKGENTAEMAEDSASLRDVFTDAEIKELETVKGLISKEEAEKIVKDLPLIGFDSKLQLYDYSISENDGDYYISLSYKNNDGEDYRYIHARLDAKTGKLLSLYNNGSYGGYGDKELTDVQKQTADRQIEKFLNAVAADEYGECEENSADYYGSTASKNYRRTVNGIKYIDDGIYIDYDVDSERITSYWLDFEDDRSFDNPDTAISAESAYDSMLNAAPLEKLYVMSEAKYKLCYTLSRYGVEIDAFSGEEYKDVNYTENYDYNYTDIGGHWAENQIKKLAEAQIGLNSDKFYPDAPISQSDILRLFAAGIHYKSYLNYDEEELYDNLIYEGILTEEEKNPQAQVTRENAFVYMVRMDGLDKVAKLYNIFKVEYADGDQLSEGKIGYPAILTGLNIICGDGGYLRPQEPITRAEAATMLYNYMIKPD